MGHSSDKAAAKRRANASSLEAFGVSSSQPPGDNRYRTIREGEQVTIFTIGYERRDGEDLMACLKDAGVECLVDVRERPMSRRPDFRGTRLAGFCEEAGIEYRQWCALGSTSKQRERLKETGDFSRFAKTFRQYASRGLSEEIEALSEFASEKCLALLCYERDHDECHRSIVADLAAKAIDASVVAIT